MANLGIGMGVILFILGIGGYEASNRVSPTALIPSFFGVVFVVLGVVARKDSLRKHAVHASLIVALLGFLGSMRGFVKLPALLSGDPHVHPLAVWMQVAMGVLCAIYIGMGVRSFRAARRLRA